jgi:hypothetical protein
VCNNRIQELRNDEHDEHVVNCQNRHHRAEYLKVVKYIRQQVYKGAKILVGVDAADFAPTPETAPSATSNAISATPATQEALQEAAADESLEQIGTSEAEVNNNVQLAAEGAESAALGDEMTAAMEVALVPDAEVTREQLDEKFDHEVAPLDSSLVNEGKAFHTTHLSPTVLLSSYSDLTGTPHALGDDCAAFDEIHPPLLHIVAVDTLPEMIVASSAQCQLHQQYAAVFTEAYSTVQLYTHHFAVPTVVFNDLLVSTASHLHGEYDHNNVTYALLMRCFVSQTRPCWISSRRPRRCSGHMQMHLQKKK